jgi:hypothetical protein
MQQKLVCRLGKVMARREQIQNCEKQFNKMLTMGSDKNTGTNTIDTTIELIVESLRKSKWLSPELQAI